MVLGGREGKVKVAARLLRSLGAWRGKKRSVVARWSVDFDRPEKKNPKKGTVKVTVLGVETKIFKKVAKRCCTKVIGVQKIVVKCAELKTK